MFTPNWISVGVMLLPSEIVIILAYKFAPLRISRVFLLQMMYKTQKKIRLRNMSVFETN